MPSISSTAPTKTGYNFGGWYDTDASSGGTQYYTASGESARTWNKENTTYTLYARWGVKTTTVSFNANGGTGGQSANVTATYGSAMPGINQTAPTKTGYTFLGWYDASSGGTQYYTAAGASARSWNKENSTYTLYAHWSANTYTVIYNGNGATSGSTASSTHTYDTPQALTANGFSKTNYS